MLPSTLCWQSRQALTSASGASGSAKQDDESQCSVLVIRPFGSMTMWLPLYATADVTMRSGWHAGHGGHGGVIKVIREHMDWSRKSAQPRNKATRERMPRCSWPVTLRSGEPRAKEAHGKLETVESRVYSASAPKMYRIVEASCSQKLQSIVRERQRDEANERTPRPPTRTQRVECSRYERHV